MSSPIPDWARFKLDAIPNNEMKPYTRQMSMAQFISWYIRNSNVLNGLYTENHLSEEETKQDAIDLAKEVYSSHYTPYDILPADQWPHWAYHQVPTSPEEVQYLARSTTRQDR